MASSRYLILSTLAHGLLLLGFLLPQEPKITHTAIEVSLSKHANKSASRGKAASRSKPLDLGLSTTKAITQAHNLTDRMEPQQTADDSSQGSGASFDPYGGLEMPEIRFVQSLWREIDKAIVSPSYLSEYGHFGKVHFVFDIDTDGSLIEESIRVNAQDKILKVIAARAIRKAVLNANGELPKPRQRTKIFSSFAWSDYQTCANSQGSGKNTLSFCNYAEDKRKQFTTTEKAATYLGALKYGFGAVEEIEKYKREEMRRNTKFNPFEEFERDPDWNLGS